MKRRITFVLFLSIFAIQNAFSAIDVQKVEPSFWWAGMKNPELQIMVYGKDIANSQVTTTAKTARLTKIVKLESSNYLFVYMDISQATPEKFDLVFQNGKDKKIVPYELKQRKAGSANRIGFNSSDVLYLLMPDRFANGDPSNDVVKGMNETTVDRNGQYARHGGDLKGIEDHLDYIKDLGVTAIWPTPVLEDNQPQGSYHGYAISDYYNVDKRFGTNEDYVKLIEKCHAKGLKMVMDMVFNHCGTANLFFKDRPSHDWFNYPDGFVQSTYRSSTVFDPNASAHDRELSIDGWFSKEMPDLNQRNPELAKYLIQNSIWWIEYAGIDGIRQDTYPYIDYDMMAEWNKEVTAEYPDFNITGETWLETPVQIAEWQKDNMFSAKNSNLRTPMNFPLKFATEKAFSEESGWGTGVTRIYDLLCQDIVYKDPSSLLIFLENHDTSRFFKSDTTETQIASYKQALTFLLTTRGIPQLYYGTEILMTGDKGQGDGYLRKDFPGAWGGDPRNEFVASGRSAKQNETFDFTKKLLNWRKGNEVISKGTMKQFVPQNSVYVYERKYQGKSIVVMLNGSEKENTINLRPYQEILPSKTAKDIISNNVISLNDSLTLAPRGIFVLEF